MHQESIKKGKQMHGCQLYKAERQRAEPSLPIHEIINTGHGVNVSFMGFVRASALV